MKRRILTALAAALLAAAGAQAAPTTLAIDRSHSEVGFNIRHYFTRVHGRFMDFSGTVIYDPADLSASRVEVAIRDSSISTGNDRRDAHLRTQDFFWTDRYPTLVFRSTKVIPGADAGHFQVVGDLTMRGITKPVTLAVEFLGMGETTIEEWNSTSLEAGFNATATIDRRDWEILWNKKVNQGGIAGFMLGDNVDLVFQVAAHAEAPKGAAPAARAKP